VKGREACDALPCARSLSSVACAGPSYSSHRQDANTSYSEEPEEIVRTTSRALARTPARVSSLAQRIPLPASPADVANAVDRSTIAIRKRAASLYQQSGISETTTATRESLSTVTSILFAVSAFELYYLRPEVLADRYAFTIPAIRALGTNDYAVQIPDVFLLLTASFWSPVILWCFTSFILPSVAGYFFNLSAASHARSHAVGRPRVHSSPEYVVDPFTYSLAKALLTYVVYAQGVTFWGLVDEASAARIKLALFGGWQGVLTGCGITALASLYDAILKK
jgi:hypothetical protein